MGVSDGATLACGGRVAEVADELCGGFYLEPTVLTDVPPTSALWREEVLHILRSTCTCAHVHAHAHVRVHGMVWHAHVRAHAWHVM